MAEKTISQSKDKTNLVILGIVAIVAIVGLVLFTGQGKTSTIVVPASTSEDAIIESGELTAVESEAIGEGDLAGQAIDDLKIQNKRNEGFSAAYKDFVSFTKSQHSNLLTKSCENLRNDLKYYQGFIPASESNCYNKEYSLPGIKVHCENYRKYTLMVSYYQSLLSTKGC